VKRWTSLVAVLAMCCLICSGVFAPPVTPVTAAEYERWVAYNDGTAGTWVTALAHDQNGVFYAGTRDEGLYKSGDACRSWQWMAETGLPASSTGRYPAINQIITSPTALGQMVVATDAGLFAGSTEHLALVSDIGASRVLCVAGQTAGAVMIAGTPDGLFRSTDGGATWTHSGAPLTGVAIQSVVFDRYVASGVLLGTSKGLFRSDDGGKSWRQVSDVSISLGILVQHPQKQEVLLAASGTGLVRSLDAGLTWTAILPTEARSWVLGIVMDSFDPTRVRLVTRSGVLASVDAGEHWAWESGPVSDQFTCAVMDSVDATSPVYCGTRTGVSRVTASIELYTAGLGFPETTAVAIDPNLNLAYSARGTGLYRAFLGGGSWTRINDTLTNGTVTQLVVDIAQPRMMYAVTTFGLRRSTDGGLGWTELQTVPAGRVDAVCCDPVVVNRFYAATTSGLYVIRFGSGATWEEISPVKSAACTNVTLAGGGGALYVECQGSLWRSTSSGESWSRAGILPDTGSAASLQGDPLDPATVYCGTKSGVFRSVDGGSSWTRWGTGLQGVWVHGLAVGSSVAAGAIVATSAGVARRVLGNDVLAPTIVLEGVQDGAHFSTSSLVISGRVTDAEAGVAALMVNQKTVEWDPISGSFSAPVSLAPGANNVEVVAKDLAGNSVSRVLHLTFDVPRTVLTLQVGSTTMLVNDGRTIGLDSAPAILRSRTFLPIRAVAEALGGTVGWDAATRTATVTLGGHQVSLQIGSNVAMLDGVRKPIDSTDALVVPVILSGRTLLPVRFVTESLGCAVGWEPASRTVTITYPAP